MTSDILFALIVSIIVLNQLLDFILDFLNISYRKKSIPIGLKDIYDEKTYKKQQAYEMEKTRFSFWNSLFNFSLILAVLFFDGFAYLDEWIRQFLNHEILISLTFFGLLMALSSSLNLPFSIYSTFVIEEKYGFNKTSLKTFLFDLLKSTILTVVIGGGLLYIVMLLYQIYGPQFWLLTWGVVTLFMLFLNIFYSQLIVPLFNKQSPLEEGELRTEIEQFSKKVGFNLKNIFVIDGSKRSSKANAYFSGLGPQKRIVLYDTLISDLNTKEIVAVLSHEVGHYKHKHTIKGLMTSIIYTGLILYLLSLFIDNPLLNQALGSAHQSFHFGLLVFGFLFEPFSLIMGIVGHYFSRKNEYQADAFSKKFELHEALISGLKKLSRNNLSNLTPHPFYVFVHYSHPTLWQRMQFLSVR